MNNALLLNVSEWSFYLFCCLFIFIAVYFYYFFILVFNCFFSTIKIILSSVLDMLVIKAKRNAVGLFQCSLAENGTMMAVRYGTVHLNFCEEIRYAGTVRFFCDGTGTVRRYGTPFL